MASQSFDGLNPSGNTSNKAVGSTNTHLRISPSKLNYWGTYNCLKCFTATMHGWVQPKGIFSPIFNLFDSHQKDYFSGRSSKELDQSLPDGTICEGFHVKSAPFVGDNGVTITVAGILDAVSENFDDSLTIIDFKTSASNPASLAKGYENQLSAYAFCLENPAQPEKVEPRKIETMGLCRITPERMTDTNEEIAEIMSATWIEVPWDMQRRASFFEILETICEIFEKPETAPSVDGCDWCHLRRQLGKPW